MIGPKFNWNNWNWNEITFKPIPSIRPLSEWCGSIRMKRASYGVV